MFNKVIVVGILTKDVELRYFPSGNGCVANISLALNRKYKKQDGSQAEEVCYIEAKIFNRMAEVANQYLRKGSKVLVEGKLAQEHWEQNGQKRSKHIIQAENLVLMDSKPQNAQQSQSTQYAQHPQQTHYQNAYRNAPSVDMTQPQSQVPEIDVGDDGGDIPF